MAFPTTPVLDTFTRADGNVGAGWTRYFTSTSDIQILSNQATAAAADWPSMYYNAATYGPNVENYIDVAVKGATGHRLDLTILTGTTLGAPNGYYVQYVVTAGVDTWQIGRYDAGAGTPLATGATTELSAGDAIGLERIANRITAYARLSGVWTPVVSAQDSTYSSPTSSIGVEPENNTWRLDNFGGGTSLFRQQSSAGLWIPTTISARRRRMARR